MQSSRATPAPTALSNQLFSTTQIDSGFAGPQYFDFPSTFNDFPVEPALPINNDPSLRNYGYNNSGSPEAVFTFNDSPITVSSGMSIASFCSDDNVEEHLIAIGTQDSNGYCAEFGRTVRLSCRSTKFTGNLRKAICFRALFLSTHPKLFPTRDFSFENRKSIAIKLYSLDPTPISFANNLEMCDEINAVMTQCVNMFSVGCTIEGAELRRKAYDLIRVLGILHPSTFGVNVNSRFQSLDDISTALLPARASRFHLTHDERAESLFALVKMLTLDMFHSIGTGYSFSINDEEFPEMPLPQANIVNIDSHKRQTISPEHTIYENTSYEQLFESVRSARTKLLPFDSLQHAIRLIQFIKLFRKTITFSRSLRYCSEDNMEKIKLQSGLHCAVLDFALNLGENSIADLTPFFWSNRESKIPSSYYHSPASPVDLPLAMLLQLCFLHFPTSEYTSRKFPITFKGPVMYSSIEILYAVIHALYFLVNRANAPAASQNSTLPSPGYLNATFPLKASIICSSAASALLKPGNDTAMALKSLEMIKCINTAIRQVSSIWPVGWAFAKNVDCIISQFSSGSEIIKFK